MNNLVIVESPTKARTLAKFLGAGYQIEASMGHIRDLPKSELGVDVANNFEPQYIIPRDKKKRVNDLKRTAEKADQIWLASDPDREGEAIAWHIKHLIESGKQPKGGRIFKRVVFHEITEEAVKEAFQHPREIDEKLVDAQQARRILDRLVGYKLSPLLWKKVKRGLSAGRVQSVALRLIVEREREVLAFLPVEYWSIEALLDANAASFKASLMELNGQRLEIANEEGKEKKNVFFINNKEEADLHVQNLQSANYQIKEVIKKQVRRQPAPPYTTSTLQQAAGNKLGFSAKKTMSVAQFLYEHGLITYMRTDSVNLAPAALSAARETIEKKFGKEYLPEKPRFFKTKSKSAQEAHEAIRPSNASTTSENLQVDGITRDHIRLYDLIWRRMMACQMAEALLDQTTIDVEAKSAPANGTEENIYVLRATGSIVKFDGWMKLYPVKNVKAKIEENPEEKPADAKEEVSQFLPEVTQGQLLKLLELLPAQHFTEPPPRFNEASLIKKLEELGIGRPSTYAPTLSTIQDRFYVEKRERKLFPTALGMAVTDFLLKNFSDIIDYSFTANMEDRLDQIAEGERQWKPTIKEFYEPFEKKLEATAETAERVQIETEKIDKPCPKCGKPLLVRYGKFGKFLACSGFPECTHTEPFEEKLDVICPLDGGDVVLRKTKKGRIFYGCKNYPTCTFASWTKPKGPNDAPAEPAAEQPAEQSPT